MRVKQTCEIPYLGTHWFDKDIFTDVIRLADLSKQYRVTMDTEKEKSTQKVKFFQMPGDLFACNPKLNENEQKNYGSKVT